MSYKDDIIEKRFKTLEDSLKKAYQVIDALSKETFKKVTLRVKKIDEAAKIPTRKYPTDAGMDVYALNDVLIEPHTIEVVKTGITADFPNGTVALVWPKSRTNFLVGAGVIDNNYQGEIMVKISNISANSLKIKKHQGIAQIVIVPVICPLIIEVDEIHENETERGETGGIAGNAK